MVSRRTPAPRELTPATTTTSSEGAERHHRRHLRGRLNTPAPAPGAHIPRRTNPPRVNPPPPMAQHAADVRSAPATTSSVVTKPAVFKLGVHPSAMHDALGGAKELLDGMLMRHHHQLGGVLVSYADARVVGTDARIIHQAGHCDVHVRCTARVFCPEPGRKLVGTVNKVGADFVGLLVMGVFNASVASADISDEFIHNPIDQSPGGCWESAEDNGEHRIAVGSDVVFVVKAVSEHDDVLHMLGSLKETRTGEATRVLGAGYAVETIGNGDGNGDAYGDVGTGKQSPEVNDLTSVEGDAATPKKKGKGKNGTSSAEKKAKSSEKKAKKEKKEKKEKSAKKEKKEKRKRED